MFQKVFQKNFSLSFSPIISKYFEVDWREAENGNEIAFCHRKQNSQSLLL